MNKINKIIIFSAFLSVIIGIIIYFYYFFNPFGECSKREIISSENTNHISVALYEENCGATDDFSEIVSLKDQKGHSVDIYSGKTRIIEGIQWKNDKQIYIRSILKPDSFLGKNSFHIDVIWDYQKHK